MNAVNKVVMITGVSSGFGKETAEYLDQKGYKVYGTSRKPQSSSKLAMVPLELTDENSIESAVKHVLAKEGHIDILINNAGIGIAGPVEDSSFDDIRLQFETNFFSWVKLTQLVLPSMRANKSGMIINISSMAGFVGLPFQSFYSASKYALEGFSEGLRHEVKPYNIKVVNINPGDFNTNFGKNRRYASNGIQNSPYLQRFSKTM
ncbi:MAG: SDR family oxidoreductase, partial [Bacteroidota bacterium]